MQQSNTLKCKRGRLFICDRPVSDHSICPVTHLSGSAIAFVLKGQETKTCWEPLPVSLKVSRNKVGTFCNLDMTPFNESLVT